MAGTLIHFRIVWEQLARGKASGMRYGALLGINRALLAGKVGRTPGLSRKNHVKINRL